MVNYDGFYLSYLAEGVRIPARDDVDQFLSVLKTQPQRTILDPTKPMGAGTHGILTEFMELRYNTVRAGARQE